MFVVVVCAMVVVRVIVVVVVSSSGTTNASDATYGGCHGLPSWRVWGIASWILLRDVDQVVFN